jgi:hypothetical protein
LLAQVSGERLELSVLKGEIKLHDGGRLVTLHKSETLNLRIGEERDVAKTVSGEQVTMLD